MTSLMCHVIFKRELCPLIRAAQFKMVGLMFLVSITVLIFSVVRGNDMFGPLVERMDSFEDDLDRVENRVKNKIDIAKISLRSELKQHMKQHVREALAELLEGESIEEMVNSQIVSEVRQLRQGNHQMKRQLQHMLKSLRDVQGDMKTCQVAVKKAEKDTNDLNMCSNHIVDSKILQRNLEQCESSIIACNRNLSVNDGEIQKLKEDLKMLNESYQHKLIIVTTPSAKTSTSASVVTTRRPIEERRRLLVAPYGSSTRKFRQLNIHSNSISNYALQSLKNVKSIAYVSRLKKLLIGVYSPDKILSSQLDSYGVTTVHENVGTYGMAVDEEREVVFIGTHSPRKSISRMTTHGKHFTVMTDLKSFSYYNPRSVAVNTKTKTIYVCMAQKVIVVSYDGRVLQTLATGKSMYAVTLDTTGGNLYYNDNKKVMKLSLSKNITTELVTLSVTPFHLVYDRNTIYFSSHGSYTGTIGAVDVRQNVTEYTLQNIDMEAFNYMICLVPLTN